MRRGKTPQAPSPTIYGVDVPPYNIWGKRTEKDQRSTTIMFVVYKGLIRFWNRKTKYIEYDIMIIIPFSKPTRRQPLQKYSAIMNILLTNNHYFMFMFVFIMRLFIRLHNSAIVQNYCSFWAVAYFLV